MEGGRKAGSIGALAPFDPQAQMRVAFEEKLDAAQQQLVGQRTEHRKELRMLREAHAEEVRVAEARARNERAGS